MGVGVASDLMTLPEDAPDQAGMILRMLPYDEKGGVDMVLTQNVEDLGSPLRIGTVIKSQGYLIRLGILKMGDGRINRKLLERFASGRSLLWLIRALPTKETQ